MAGLAGWWRSMPRGKQLIAAIAIFWLLYACAAVYEWTVDGKVDPAAARAASTVATTPADTDTALRAAAASPRVLTGGDLAVLLAAAFIVAALSATFILARRELRGPRREEGMGSFDDPIWSGADLDLPAPWLLGHAGSESPPR